MRGFTAHHIDGGGLQRLAVERTLGHPFGAAPFDPLLAKVGLAAGEEPEIRAHFCSIVGDEPLETTIVVAMAVAQNKAVDPARIKVEQLEIQQISGFTAGLGGFQMQGQPPLAGKCLSFVPGNMADELDFDQQMPCIFDEAVIKRVDEEPDRMAPDDGGCEWLGSGQLDAHRPFSLLLPE